MIPFFALSQVGIGTVTPNAQLEIKSTNQSTPTNTDGIIIPKIDEFPATYPTAAQDGMMVYVTGVGTETKGFYYWDNGLSNWDLVNGAESIDELTDGSTIGGSVFLGLNAGANDDGTTNRNVGIGVNNLNQNDDGFANVAVGFEAMNANIGGVFNTALGYFSLRNNVNRNGNVAIGLSAGYNLTGGNYNTFLGHQAGIGTVAFSMEGAVFVGSEAGHNETNDNRLYIENSDADADNALIYGEFGTDNTTTGNVLRVNGELQLGNSITNRYAMPTTDGTTNQVIQTDGFGNLSWADNTSMGTDNQNISGSSLSGTTLTIGIEGGTNETVDLSTLQDGGAQEINDLNDGKTDATSLFLGTSSGTLDDGTANSNVGVGHNSLGGVTGGYRNTAIGYVSMLSNNTGFANTAIGYYSLGLVTSGHGNVAVGHWAARDAVGSRNTVVGTTAFADNVSGDNNTILGESAARNLTGSNNTMLGRQTGIGSGPYTMNGSVFIGNNVGANESNSYRLYIDNSNTANL